MVSVSSIFGFLDRHHLPIGLTLAIFIGALVPSIGVAILSFPVPVSSLSVALIFLIQGLKLETGEARDALTSVRAVIYGLTFILLISPMLAIPLVQLDMLEPIELTLGVALFLSMPTTISTGAVLTREAQGNTSLAVLLSVASTMLGLVVLPFTIETFALSQASVELDIWSFLLNLSLTVLLPLIVGKLIRDYLPRALEMIQSTSSISKYLSSVALILVPFLQISKSSEAIRNLSISSIVLTCAVGCVVHMILLTCNWFVCRFGSGLLKIDDAKKKAVIFACSGKTIAIGIAVLPMLDYDEQKKGIMAVPLVVSHLIQTIIDSIIANKWKDEFNANLARERANNDSETATSIEMPLVDSSSLSFDSTISSPISPQLNEHTKPLLNDQEEKHSDTI